MRDLIGTHDLLMVTLDTLRHDVAATELAAGRTPNLARALPGGRWQRRHTPASFTYAAHHAFFAGFLPTPADPPPPGEGAAARLFAARFPGSETCGPDTWIFDAADLPGALAAEGYHTLCLGGVGFFNRSSPLGSVLPGLFAEAYWEPAFGVSAPDCVGAQLDRLAQVVASLPVDRPLFTFLNVAALHQPNRHYLPGAGEDGPASHAAALRYVDGQLPRLFRLVTGRGRPVFTIICSDHGTAYGEDGRTGHRLGHEVVWTVPYADLTLHPGTW